MECQKCVTKQMKFQLQQYSVICQKYTIIFLNLIYLQAFFSVPENQLVSCHSI